MNQRHTVSPADERPVDIPFNPVIISFVIDAYTHILPLTDIVRSVDRTGAPGKAPVKRKMEPQIIAPNNINVPKQTVLSVAAVPIVPRLGEHERLPMLSINRHWLVRYEKIEAVFTKRIAR